MQPKSRKRLQPHRDRLPTLREVAEFARVSTATVSRALNRPNSVRPILRDRVRQAVKSLGYVPHGAARALASHRSRIVGTIIPTIDNAIFARGIQALQRRLSRDGYTLLLASSGYDLEREFSEARILVERGVDALMLVGEEHQTRLFTLLETAHLPYVSTWVYRERAPHPCIGFDNRLAALRITTHLLDLGHRSIAMIAGITTGNDRAKARVAGVRETLRAHGLALAPGNYIEMRYSIKAGGSAMRALLAREQPPTAVICGNDVLALGALFECQARGVAVPSRISLTGFDDLELAAQVVPPLTTMRVPSREMGVHAAEYLLARLAGDSPPDRIELEASLILRATTAPAPR